jgi:hypothetical protein
LTRRRRQLLIAVFALGFVTAHGDPTLGQTTPGETAREAIPNAISRERFWMAGLELFDYRDGIDVTDMRSLQSISHGE